MWSAQYSQAHYGPAQYGPADIEEVEMMEVDPETALGSLHAHVLEQILSNSILP